MGAEEEMSAEQFKQEGNERFKQGDVEGAMSFWMKALELEGSPPDMRISLLSNLSLGALQTGKYTDAMLWATRAIENVYEGVDPKTLSKSYARRGCAARQCGYLHQAHDDLRNASLLCPSDTGILAELQNTQEEAAEQCKTKSNEMGPLEPIPIISNGSIPRYHWNDPAVQEHLQNGTPMIIAGSSLAVPAVAHWTPEYLKAHMGSIKCTVFQSENDISDIGMKQKTKASMSSPSTLQSSRWTSMSSWQKGWKQKQLATSGCICSNP